MEISALKKDKATKPIIKDILPLNGTDYIEFYVGNAKQAAHFYETVFGFEIIAYTGPEPGVRDRASYVVKQGKIRLVLTASMNGNSEISVSGGDFRLPFLYIGKLDGKCGAFAY